MEDLLNVVGNVGFPIAVAAYLLIRIEGKLNELSSAISGLREAIITMPQHWGTTRPASLAPLDNGKAYPPV
ncbi:MAG: YvrJ family protein [Syntrophomonas sp.]